MARPRGRIYPRRFHVIAALLLFSSVVACGNPDVTGYVSVPTSPDVFKRAGNVEVLLVHNNLRATLREMATQTQADIVREAGQTVLQPLKKRAAAEETELWKVRAALRELEPTPRPSSDTARTLTNCIERATEDAALARSRYHRWFATLQPHLTEIGVEASDPQTAQAQLLHRLDTDLEDRAMELNRAYVRQHISLHASVIFNLGKRSSDQLCGVIANTGQLNVLEVALQVTYNGTLVPKALVRRYWSSTNLLGHVKPRVWNGFGEEVQGIPPGEKFRRCLYSLRPALTRRERHWAHEVGLPHRSGARSGKWDLQVLSATLTDAKPVRIVTPGSSAVHWTVEARRLIDVFATDLAPLRKQLPAGRLVDQLTAADEAHALRQSTARLELCRRSVELEKILTRQRSAIAALEQGNTDAPEARRRIEERIQHLRNDPRRRSALVARASEIIETNLVRFQKTSADGSFHFRDVEPGSYTLVSTHKTSPNTSVTWIVPANVNGKVTASLGRQNVHEGGLPEVLERLLLPERPTAATAAPNEAASKPTPTAHTLSAAPSRRSTARL